MLWGGTLDPSSFLFWTQQREDSPGPGEWLPCAPPPETPAPEPCPGVAAIAAERHRQMTEEGWTAEHDDQHRNGEMATAAHLYVNHTVVIYRGVPMTWPWDDSWWKPGPAKRMLEKSGGLIAAEWARLDREEKRSASNPDI